MRKFFPAIILVIAVFFAVSPFAAYAQSLAGTKVSVVVFVREGCVHCQDEEQFLQKLSKSRDDFTDIYYRLENAKDKKAWEELTERAGISKVTPITVVGEYYIVGFEKENTTGKEITALIDKAKKANISTDIASRNLKGLGAEGGTCDESGLVPCNGRPSYYISLPFLGKIDAQKYPLFFLSAILGFFDGFNPCAMWVLVTFLIILLQVGNRRKMALFAGTFIVAEAVMYTLILTVWFKTWDFVKLDTVITPAVGVLAIVGGVFFLNEWRKKEIECKVMDLDKRHKTRQKIKELATGKFTLVTFLAILGIAFSVNVIEFACSVGIPQAFTKILELNKLPVLWSGLSIFIYILFYMIDDLVVFAIALYGADKLHLTTKYSKLSNLWGGAVMVILGLLLIFKPDFLLF